MHGVSLSRHLVKGLIQIFKGIQGWDIYLVTIFQLIFFKVYILYHLKEFLLGLIQAANDAEIQAKKLELGHLG